MRFRAALLGLCAWTVAWPAGATAYDLRPGVILRMDLMEAAVVAGVKNTPAGRIGTAAWSVADFTMSTADAAIDREAEIQKAQLVAIELYSDTLKTWAAAGVDLQRDRRAIEVKASLRELGVAMTADNLDAADFMMRAVQRNLGYAVKRVAFDKAVKLGFGRIAKRVVGKAPGWADGRRRGMFHKVLKAANWTRLKDREAAARGLPGKYMEEVLTAEADLFVDMAFRDAKDDVFRRVYEGMSANVPRAEWPAHVRLYVARAEPVPVQPAMPVPQAVVAMAVAPARLVPQAIPIQILAPDPVKATVMAEDRRMPTAWAPSRPEPTIGPGPETTIGPAPQPEPPDPREEARRARFRHELMCVGAGVKAGCGDETWDGDRKSRVQP